MTIRCLIGTTRSGTTALLRAFENNPHVKAVCYQPFKSSIRATGKVSYNCFNLDKQDPNNIYIIKDTIGKALPTSSMTEINYRTFRDIADLEKARHIFLFRNPFNSYKSHLKFNWKSSIMGNFKDAYYKTYQQAIEAKQLCDRVSILTLEHLAKNPHYILQIICKKWNIPYHKSMIKWDLPFGTKFLISDNEKQLMYSTFRAEYKKVMESKGLVYDNKANEKLNFSRQEENNIVKNLLPIFQEMQKLAEIDFPIAE